MTQEALRMALDALETELSIDWTNNDEFNASAEKMHKAITAIKETLAQTQEPVHSVQSNGRHSPLLTHMMNKRTASAQPEQEPVEMYRNKCADGSRCLHGCHTNEPCYTHPPQRIEQEPVACIYKGYLYMAHEFQSGQVPVDSQPLYTTPPQRTWVGLTDEQIEKCYETTGHYQTLRPQDRFAVFALARAIEAKLKEKNT